MAERRGKREDAVDRVLDVATLMAVVRVLVGAGMLLWLYMSMR